MHGRRNTAGVGNVTRRALAGLAVAIAVLPGPAAAQGSRPQLLIVQTELDPEAETLLIQGRYFRWASDDAVVVTLGGTSLPVHGVTEVEILAQLPSDLAAGAYLLKVSRGSGVVQNDTFALTVGAVGPQGPQGPQGPHGPMGDTGPPGLPGQQGSTGDRGEAGPQGPRGPKSLNARGAWGAGADYQTDDAVSHEGSSWIAVAASRGVSPAEGESWTLIAAKGATGAQGLQGETGPEGPQGLRGPAGPMGDKGDPGPPFSCADGDFVGCYTGPSASRGQGTCRAGERTCTDGQFGVCSGEVTPAIGDVCNGLDDDCDGAVDEDGCETVGETRACGNGGTQSRTCFPSGECTAWGTCSG